MCGAGSVGVHHIDVPSRNGREGLVVTFSSTRRCRCDSGLLLGGWLVVGT
jgi:hypothetical protein